MTQLPTFLSKEKEPMMNEPTKTSEVSVDIAARARSGAEAVDALIKERDHHKASAQNLSRHYDANRATIENLERQNSLLDAKLTYYQNLSTSLLTRLSTISMTVEDAMRESREAAAKGESLHTSRPGVPGDRFHNPRPGDRGPVSEGPSTEQLRLESLAKRLAPDQEPLGPLT